MPDRRTHRWIGGTATRQRTIREMVTTWGTSSDLDVAPARLERRELARTVAALRSSDD
jgi:ribosomal protein S2